jgi:hypothetical protein
VSARRVAALGALALALLAVAWVVLLRGDGGPAARPAKPAISARPATPATPATLEQVFDAAGGGDTIALAAGDYGTFRGGVKPSTVTLVAEKGVTATMNVEFDGAAHIRIQGLTLKGMELNGTTHDVTIANSRFTGMGLVRAAAMADAHILLDRVTFAGIDKCDRCFEGRLTITGDSGAPSGIVVRDSTFGPGGVSDGILNGGHGVQILRNRFVDLQGGSVDGVHVDAIQLYGSRDTVIRRNQMENVATGIMAPDGTDHEIIEGNRIDPGEYPYGILLGGDVGSVIRRNRLPDGACAFDKRCGTLVIESDKDGKPSRGTVVEDNILGDLQIGEGSTLAAQARNTIAALTGAGSG